jgi:putative tryptophan/tyrosine transport system permease protein
MLTDIALLGAVEIGFVYALVAMGVYLSFRVLDFPDLTVDGSFPLGAAVSAVLLVAGVDPWLTLLAAMAAGALAGIVTALLYVRFHILHLLASILTMTALFSVNLRVMGKPNVALLMQDTVFTPFQGLGLSDAILKPIGLGLVALVAVVILARFLGSEFGLAMRATGANPRMARAQGIDTDLQIYAGMALSNGLAGLSGALFAQANGFADATVGIGTIVVGLAAVIVGETVLPSRRIVWALVGCVIGSVLYRLAIQVALTADVIGLQASDLNLVTAALVAVALILPRLKRAGVRR